MKDVVDRMKQAEKDSANNARIKGHELGALWARDYATPDQLKRLEAGCNPQYAWGFASDRNDAYSNFEHFVFIIDPEDDGDRGAADTFWEAAAGEDYASRWSPQEAEFVNGFAEGAISVWGQIKAKI